MILARCCLLCARKTTALLPLRSMASKGQSYRKIKPGQILGRQTLKERLSPQADGVNVRLHLLVAGSSAACLGLLCLAGSKMNKDEENGAWSPIVRSRIESTYKHVGSAVCMVGIATGAVGVATITATITLDLGADSDILGTKHAVWASHCASLGAVLACTGGSAVVYSSAAVVAAMTLGLSAVSSCAPSDRFLNIAGPLGMGLGTTFLTSLAPWFAPSMKLLSPAMIPVYGVSCLCAGLLIYNMQNIIDRAKTHPFFSKYPYDPVNNAMLLIYDAARVIRKEDNQKK